jgi:hypothetical protein
MLLVEILVENWTVLVFLAITLGISVGAFIYFKKINATQEVEFLFGSVLAPIAGAIFLVVAISGMVYIGGKLVEGFSRVESLEDAVNENPILKEENEGKSKTEQKSNQGEREEESSGKDLQQDISMQQATAGSAGRAFNNTQKDILEDANYLTKEDSQQNQDEQEEVEAWIVESITYEGGWGIENARKESNLPGYQGEKEEGVELEGLQELEEKGEQLLGQ